MGYEQRRSAEQPSKVMPAVVQEPADLVLAVGSGTPRPMPTVLDEAVVTHAGIRARFQVISASHLVQLEVDGHPWFHETLSCQPLPTSAAGAPDVLHAHAFGDLRDHHAVVTPAAGEPGTYRVVVRVIPPSSGQAEPEDPRVGPGRLEVAFPPVHGQVPITRIVWVPGMHQLTWTTLHTYPRVDGIWRVTSRSVLELTGGDDRWSARSGGAASESGRRHYARP